MSAIDQHIEQINALCRKYRVRQLEVFGSVARNQEVHGSDVDLLVQFADVDLAHYADNYFEFKEALEDLFGRPVDLLEDQAIKNPFIRQSIDASKKLVYAE